MMVKLLRALTTIAMALPVALPALGAQAQDAPPPNSPPPNATSQAAPSSNTASPDAQAREERNLNELRNTVVNLLQGLVDRRAHV